MVTFQLELNFDDDDNRKLANLNGQFDENLKNIERTLHIDVANRGSIFTLTGDKGNVTLGGELLKKLYAKANSSLISPQDIHLEIQGIKLQSDQNKKSSTEVSIETSRLKVLARGERQKDYVLNIRKHDVCFGIGPAGTGKTYLAVACAVSALESAAVKRVCLVRPAVEAGERLGFLPGDMAQKVDPYLRPLYDALYEMLGYEKVSKLIEKNIIEVAPLAFMRGRSLNESFIILDEAQNTTPEQMKMFLTRIGYGSKAVVTGDITQIDLPPEKDSGLQHAAGVLKNVSEIGFSYFLATDAVRHKLVIKILKAYDQCSNIVQK